MARPVALAASLALTLALAAVAAAPAAAQPRRAAAGGAPTAQSDAEDVVTVARFMIEIPVPPAEEAELRARMVAQHDAALARDPHFFDDERAEARVIRRTTLWTAQTAYRTRLWAGAVRLLAQRPDVARALATPAGAAQYPLLQFVLARNPILVNTGDGTTVLRSDLMNVVASQAVAVRLAAGQTALPTCDELAPAERALERALPALWPRLSPQDQQRYIYAEPAYTDLELTVRFDPQGRAQLINTARQQLRTAADAPRVAWALDDQAVGLERRREARADADFRAFMRRAVSANMEITRMGLLANQFTRLSHVGADCGGDCTGH